MKDSLFKAGSYKIVHEAKKDKENAILEMEGRCPVCNTRHGVTALLEESNLGSNRYHYTCPECGTEWLGNTYDKGWNPQNPAKILAGNSMFVVNLIYALLTSVLMLAFRPLAAPIFFFHIALLGVWAIARLFELGITGDTSLTRHLRNFAGMAMIFNYLTLIFFVR